MEFYAFCVFVSLVSVLFMTTEKQHTKCENSEFCFCCEEGNIWNVFWWGGATKGLLEGHLEMELSYSCTTE